MSRKGAIRRELAARELARRHFRYFLPYVHGPAWKQTRLAGFLADTIQRFVEEKTGHAFDILLLHTPPQHGKSMTVTESFPAWYLGRYPQRRVILASYNAETAERFGRRNQEKLEAWGRTLFGVERGRIWTKGEMELRNGWGRLLSRGIMSGITGNPAELLIIDDPIKNREEADSPVYRRQLWEEWQNTLKSRLAAGAKVIVIMTPWHEDDLAHRLARMEAHVQVLRLPVEAGEEDPLGRCPGQPLAPELGKDERWLSQFRKSYLSDPRGGGARAWQALYLCRPGAEGGSIVRRDWWRYYDPGQQKDYDLTVISVDAAFKGGENNDFVAVQVWSRRGGDLFLRSSLNRRMEFPETVQAILQAKARFPEARFILIEDKANGSAVIQLLQRQLPGVVAIDPRGGKEARVHAMSPAVESGHVFLPREEGFSQELVEQFAAFPRGRHDDMVDAASQCITWLLAQGRGKAVLPPRRDEAACLTDPALYAVY